MVLEPHPGGALPLEQIRRDVIARLPDLPRYTQRLSHPRTGGLHWPTWEEDRDFRVERHVFPAGLHAPGGRDELMEWAGEYYSQRLDRTKPLWEIAVLELADGRWALVTKTHHCMIDGVGSVDLATILLDTERERPERAVNGSSNGGVRLGVQRRDRDRRGIRAHDPAAGRRSPRPSRTAARARCRACGPVRPAGRRGRRRLRFPPLPRPGRLPALEGFRRADRPRRADCGAPHQPERADRREAHALGAHRRARTS